MTDEYQYLNLLSECLNKGVEYNDRTGVGRKGVWQRTLRFDLTENKWPLITTKKMPWKSTVRELLWFISGSTYEPHLEEMGCKFWKPWSPQNGELGPIYGHRFRNAGASKLRLEKVYNTTNKRWINTNFDADGVDQLKHLIHEINNNPNSTRHIINLWDEHEAFEGALPPCHIIFHCKVIENQLYSFLYQRSCDLPIGVPFNIASYSLLTKLIAHATDLEPVEFVHQLGDAHIYKNQTNQIKEQINREPYNEPILKINNNQKGLDSLTNLDLDDLELIDYNYHPKLEIPVAV